MNKQDKDWKVKNGDKFSFVLDLNTGLFKISLNGELLVKTMNMKGKKVRPSLSVYFRNTKVRLLNEI